MTLPLWSLVIGHFLVDNLSPTLLQFNQMKVAELSFSEIGNIRNGGILCIIFT